ncbi:unnamed protein product, partial [Allacma fusca]
MNCRLVCLSALVAFSVIICSASPFANFHSKLGENFEKHIRGEQDQLVNMVYVLGSKPINSLMSFYIEHRNRIFAPRKILHLRQSHSPEKSSYIFKHGPSQTHILVEASSQTTPSALSMLPWSSPILTTHIFLFETSPRGFLIDYARVNTFAETTAHLLKTYFIIFSAEQLTWFIRKLPGTNLIPMAIETNNKSYLISSYGLKKYPDFEMSSMSAEVWSACVHDIENFKQSGIWRSGITAALYELSIRANFTLKLRARIQSTAAVEDPGQNQNVESNIQNVVQGSVVFGTFVRPDPNLSSLIQQTRATVFDSVIFIYGLPTPVRS